ncbi:hypothetical protein [Sinorhizobium fredii]
MQITRAELYARVCSSPLSKIAPELGLSGTALAAICKKHQVPYPGSGYWTRKSLGLAVEPPPLPEGDNEFIDVTPPSPRKSSTAPRRKSTPRKSKDEAKPIRRAARHPLLIGVEANFRKTRDIEEGEFLRPWKRILPDVVASEPSLNRAVDIANALYTALDREGHRVLVAPAQEKMRRVEIKEQETPYKERRYGRYHTGSIWAPDRPTIAYIGTVPIGLALTEMTQRVTMRYINGTYYREDSKLVRSAKPRQLVNSWTTEQDLPCGRFRLVAYSPLHGVDWHVAWQESAQQPMGTMISQIIKKLEGSEGKLRRLMTAAEEEAARQQREWEEMWERHRRQEDERCATQALTESRQQLAEIIDKWGKAMVVERFFAEAEERLQTVLGERQEHLKERLALARSLLVTLDPLDFLGEWLSPQERYKSKDT